MSRVRISSSALLILRDPNPGNRRFHRLRAIGAAVARFPDTEEVTGSIPVSPTKQSSSPALLFSCPHAGCLFPPCHLTRFVKNSLARIAFGIRIECGGANWLRD